MSVTSIWDYRAIGSETYKDCLGWEKFLVPCFLQHFVTIGVNPLGLTLQLAVSAVMVLLLKC